MLRNRQKHGGHGHRTAKKGRWHAAARARISAGYAPAGRYTRRMPAPRHRDPTRKAQVNGPRVKPVTCAPSRNPDNPAPDKPRLPARRRPFASEQAGRQPGQSEGAALPAIDGRMGQKGAARPISPERAGAHAMAPRATIPRSTPPRTRPLPGGSASSPSAWARRISIPSAMVMKTERGIVLGPKYSLVILCHARHMGDERPAPASVHASRRDWSSAWRPAPALDIAERLCLKPLPPKIRDLRHFDRGDSTRSYRSETAAAPPAQPCPACPACPACRISAMPGRRAGP